MLAFGGTAYALEAPLTATHSIVAQQPNGDGFTTLTLQVTVHNGGGEALSAVSLLPLPGMPVTALPTAESLDLDFVPAGHSASAEWSVTVGEPVEYGSPLLQFLTFAVEANAADGQRLTFPVNSTEDAP